MRLVALVCMLMLAACAAPAATPTIPPGPIRFPPPTADPNAAVLDAIGALDKRLSDIEDRLDEPAPAAPTLDPALLHQVDAIGAELDQMAADIRTMAADIQTIKASELTYADMAVLAQQISGLADAINTICSALGRFCNAH